MTKIGTATSKNATKMLLLGSGELGKEVAIEAARLGLYVIAVDRYENAPAMQIAHENHIINMLDKEALFNLIKKVKPDYIVPEIEAIATDQLVLLEKEGFNVVPNSMATKLTMDREGIRRFAHEDLGLPTSPYQFADKKEDFLKAVKEIGFPAVIKPVMSSSGHGQSVIKKKEDIEFAWQNAQEGGRAGAGRVIIEKFLNFDYEITLLTVRHINGTSFLEPIGHRQESGDYRESWQPQPMKPEVLKEAQSIAKAITDGIGGLGLFGVELFVMDDHVYFSEVSPRPHDTGMVTMISQNLSEFALHVRAILGLPIPNIRQYGPAASAAIIADGVSHNISFSGLENALVKEDTSLRIFSKPEINGSRRLAVGLALGNSLEEAKDKAKFVRDNIKISFE